METKRNWALGGGLAGVLLGLSDYALFVFLGIDMQLAGRTVTGEVSALLTLTYVVMGFVIGKLREARTQAREDARTIAEQLTALETSKRTALQNEKLAALGRLAAGIAHFVRQAARSPSTVLISGESGTGKELIARAVHYHSDRVGRAFVAVNCKAFAEGVLESELFGHEKGAFTGADRAKVGLFERADGGTLFLDEIGEVSGDFQAKLLRVLQERTFQRVGGTTEREVDIRLVAATNRDLQAEVTAGHFREDLYFRLAVIPIHLPLLRERREDILPLARHFLAKWNAEMSRTISGWTDAVETHLLHHLWPGNVRELENTIERGVVLAQGDLIDLDDLLVGADKQKDQQTLSSEATEAGSLQDFLDHAIAKRIRTVLKEVNGARQEAARRLDIDRTTLYRLMRKYRVTATD